MPPRPKPTALRVLTGNRGRRPLPKNEPKPKAATGTMPPPKHLSAKALEVWPKVCGLLAGMGVLTVADEMAVERLVECYAEIARLTKTLDGYGSNTYQQQAQSGDTMTRAYPEVAMRADADRRFRQYLIEFGLTPASRAKVEASKDGANEKAEDKYFG